MSYGRMAQSIAAEWRAVERALLAVPRDSVEATAFRRELAVLLDEYRRLVNDAQADIASRPQPPRRSDPPPS
jgi:hypothetical protein